MNDSELKYGNGMISGYLSLGLSILSLLSVIVFHFPQFFSTPELRVGYNIELLRYLLSFGIALSLILSLVSLYLNKKKVYGILAMTISMISIFLGGSRVQIDNFEQSTLYLGLDWFILALVGTGILFVLLEKLFPQDKTQKILRKGWKLDLEYFFINHLLIGITLLVTNWVLFTFFSWSVNSQIQIFIQSIPIIFQFLIALFVADLTQYWIHYAYHKVPFLWKFHAIHHSAEKLDWLAGSRIHVVELFLTRQLVLIPLFVFGFSKGALDLYIIFIAFHAVLIHSNVSFKFGFLSHVIVTPKYHFWHHSTDKSAIDKNFAGHLPIIDKIFGTSYINKKWPKKLGVSGDQPPNTLFKQFLWSFK